MASKDETVMVSADGTEVVARTAADRVHFTYLGYKEKKAKASANAEERTPAPKG